MNSFTILLLKIYKSWRQLSTLLKSLPHSLHSGVRCVLSISESPRMATRSRLAHCLDDTLAFMSILSRGGFPCCLLVLTRLNIVGRYCASVCRPMNVCENSPAVNLRLQGLVVYVDSFKHKAFLPLFSFSLSPLWKRWGIQLLL